MSIEAMTDCWKLSPFRHSRSHAKFVVHLAIADVVNDVHGNQFWMERDELAVKAFSSLRTVAEVLHELSTTGWMAVLEAGGGRGHTTRWQYFLSGNGAADARFDDETVQPAAVNGAASRASTTSIPREPNAHLLDAQSLADGFELWWTGNGTTNLGYPLKKDKARARTAYAARIREGATHAMLVAGRDGYIAEREAEQTDLQFYKHGATLLAKDGPWTEHLNRPADELEDPGSMQQQLARAQQFSGGA